MIIAFQDTLLEMTRKHSSIGTFIPNFRNFYIQKEHIKEHIQEIEEAIAIGIERRPRLFYERDLCVIEKVFATLI